MALEPETMSVWVRDHFDNLTDEQFITNVRRHSPDLAREMWGDMPVSEILSRRDAALQSAAEGPSPRPRVAPRRWGIAGVLASFRHSVLRLFS